VHENSEKLTPVIFSFTPTTTVPIGGKLIIGFPNYNLDGSINYFGNLGIVNAGD